MRKDIFFDLDHTLWDFKKNAEETLYQLFDEFNLQEYSAHTPQDFADIYHRINDELWELYNRGMIKKEYLRTERFVRTFLEMEYPKDAVPNNLWEHYLDICPTKSNLIPGTLELLDYLIPSYSLHLITNGFSETQYRKLKNTGLSKYFQSVTISEEVGYQKPHPEIFKIALQNADSILSTGTYIGDNLYADVKGGLNSGWRVFWYNPSELVFEDQSQHTRLTSVKTLVELVNHF